MRWFRWWLIPHVGSGSQSVLASRISNNIPSGMTMASMVVNAVCRWIPAFAGMTIVGAGMTLLSIVVDSGTGGDTVSIPAIIPFPDLLGRGTGGEEALTTPQHIRDNA